MDNLGVLTSVPFLIKIYFIDGHQTALRDGLYVYFTKVNIQNNYGHKNRKGREREHEYFNVAFVTLVLLQGILLKGHVLNAPLKNRCKILATVKHVNLPNRYLKDHLAAMHS